MFFGARILEKPPTYPAVLFFKHILIVGCVASHGDLGSRILDHPPDQTWRNPLASSLEQEGTRRVYSKHRIWEVEASLQLRQLQLGALFNPLLGWEGSPTTIVKEQKRVPSSYFCGLFVFPRSPLGRPGPA